MLSFKIVVCLGTLIAVAMAKVKTECEIKTNFAIEQVNIQQEDQPEASLCLMKCEGEKAGALDSEGRVNIVKMNGLIDKWVGLNEENKAEANECLKTVPPVKTCADIKPIKACVAKSKANQKRECEVKTNYTWEQAKKELKNPSEAALCLMKCDYEKAGVLDSEGKLNMVKLNEQIDIWLKLNEKNKAEASECLKPLAPVKTCEDLRPINACIIKNKV